MRSPWFFCSRFGSFFSSWNGRERVSGEEKADEIIKKKVCDFGEKGTIRSDEAVHKQHSKTTIKNKTMLLMSLFSHNNMVK